MNKTNYILTIFGTIDKETERNFSTVIEKIKNPAYSRLIIYINSPGGNVDIAWNITRTLEMLKKQGLIITGVITHKCESAAGHIFMSIDKENRFFASDDCTYLIHPCSISLDGYYTLNCLKKQRNRLINATEKIFPQLEQNTKIPTEILEKAKKDDVVLSSQEMIDYEIANPIGDYNIF